MQVRPIKRKIFAASTRGLNTAAIATSPTDQQYSFARTARTIKKTAPRITSPAVKGSYLLARNRNMEAASSAGTEIHFMILVLVWNTIFLPTRPSRLALGFPQTLPSRSRESSPLAFDWIPIHVVSAFWSPFSA